MLELFILFGSFECYIFHFCVNFYDLLQPTIYTFLSLVGEYIQFVHSVKEQRVTSPPDLKCSSL